ncbi:helix-turn-helix domain-containing protein [Streptomyces sp. NPDC047461]|uniref:helix-turn-helix domain-containing protein n=1 Tax=Streptomyces sp. NPDC047461 TaxID=3155619 RepID=UPI0033E2F9AD
MATTNVQAKVSALMWLAAGKSQRAAAEAAGVSPGTVSAWCRQPAFAEELAALRTLYGQKPFDGAALMDRLAEAEKRLAPARSAKERVRKVRVRVPAGAPAEEVRAQARRAVARAVTRDVKAAIRRAES